MDEPRIGSSKLGQARPATFGDRADFVPTWSEAALSRLQQLQVEHRSSPTGQIVSIELDAANGQIARTHVSMGNLLRRSFFIRGLVPIVYPFRLLRLRYWLERKLQGGIRQDRVFPRRAPRWTNLFQFHFGGRS
jgi:hypothetical protein